MQNKINFRYIDEPSGEGKQGIQEDNCYLFAMTPIELIGYAKNNIVEVQKSTNELPDEYKNKLHQAYSLLNDVQEYLFEH